MLSKRIKKGSLILLLSFVLLFCVCGRYVEFKQPLAIDESFLVKEPKPGNLIHYLNAAKYSEKYNGRSVLVVHEGEIVFEKYQNGNSGDVPHHVFSGTKSFAGIMALAALADGIISLDEKVADTITEFRSDPRKSQITVRHLLQFTSGIEQKLWYLTRDGLLEKQRVHDKYAYSLGLDAKTEPGQNYGYGSSHLMVFGEFMKRKLQQDPLFYLESQVLNPIGMRYAGWNRDPAGNPMLPYGCWTTAREWAKLGQLVIQDGEWKGKQLLPSGLLETCSEGSKAMPAYGLTFWLNNPVPFKLFWQLPFALRRNVFDKDRTVYPGGPKDLIIAAGHDENRLYIIPSKSLVIVRLSLGDNNFRDRDFLDLLLGKKN